MQTTNEKCAHEYYEYANYRSIVIYNDNSWRPFSIEEKIAPDEKCVYAEVQVLMCKKCLCESAAWRRL